MNLENLQKVLLECYSKKLCYPKVQDNWSKDNKSYGMCAITALIINDYFGGQICKIYVDKIISNALDNIAKGNNVEDNKRIVRLFSNLIKENSENMLRKAYGI